MTEKRSIEYGTQRILSFARTQDPDILINSNPIKHYLNFVQLGISINKQYFWNILESIDPAEMLVVFPTGTNPSGKITFYILPSTDGIPEFEVEFSMNQTIAENAYLVDLSHFPPIKEGKVVKLVSDRAASSLVIIAEYCHIYPSITPSLVI